MTGVQTCALPISVCLYCEYVMFDFEFFGFVFNFEFSGFVFDFAFARGKKKNTENFFKKNL